MIIKNAFEFFYGNIFPGTSFPQIPYIHQLIVIHNVGPRKFLPDIQRRDDAATLNVPKSDEAVGWWFVLLHSCKVQPSTTTINGNPGWVGGRDSFDKLFD